MILSKYIVIASILILFKFIDFQYTDWDLSTGVLEFLDVYIIANFDRK